MAASSPQLLSNLARQGYAAISPAHGLQSLTQLLLASQPPVVMAAPFLWERFLAPANRAQLAFFAAVRPKEPAGTPLPLPPTLKAAAPPASAIAAAPAASVDAARVLPVVQQLLAELTGQEAGAAPGTPFLEAGLDSIGAVELR